MQRAPNDIHGGALRSWGGSAAWSRGDTSPDDWLVPIEPAALAELERLAAAVETDPRAVTARERVAPLMPACARLMRTVRERIDDGRGVAILEGLPLDGLGDAEAAALGGALATLLAPVVAQTYDGVRLYRVEDTGARPGPGVRRSLTNVGQSFHTDGPWIRDTARYVGLLCVRPGAVGGVSRLASLVTAHDRLLDEAPELLARLYGRFWWDRQREHGPDEPMARELPVFESRDGELRARHYADYVLNGHRLAGKPLDAEGEAAIGRLDALLGDEDSYLEYTLSRGQMLLVDNRRLVHARTAFGDADPGPRQLVRVWMRLEGGAALDG